MFDRYRDYEHLLRLVMLFVAGALLFVVVRAALVPEGFGELGHYRTGAIEDNRERAVAFAGQVACAECHEDALATKSRGAHAGVRCEACHGPLAAHAADPATEAPAKPSAPGLCLVCHSKNVAKPAGFPQVEPADHAGGEACGTCHAPHNPAVS